METSSGELGLELAVTPELTVSAGARLETRKVASQRSESGAARVGSEETEHTGYWANIGWRPSRVFRLTAELDSSSYDDPFTLASPKARERYRVRAQYGTGQGLSASVSALHNDFENSVSGWSADYDQVLLRLGYRRGSLALSLGYSLVDLRREMDQLVEVGTSDQLPFLILYEAESDFLDGRVLWAFHHRWRFGGELRLYENDGSFTQERSDARGWLEARLGRAYIAHIGYRVVDYDEGRRDFDDYDARIAEISIGYRW